MICIFLYFNNVIIPDGYNKTTAIVIDIEIIFKDHTHTSEYILEYEVDGITYTMRDSKLINQKIGTEVEILYNTKNPEDAMVRYASIGTNILFILICITCFVFSIIILINGIIKLRKNKYLNTDNNMQ